MGIVAIVCSIDDGNSECDEDCRYDDMLTPSLAGHGRSFEPDGVSMMGKTIISEEDVQTRRQKLSL